MSHSIDNLVREVRKRFGQIDILVRNAINRYPGHVDDYPKASWGDSDASRYNRSLLYHPAVTARDAAGAGWCDHHHRIGSW